MRRGRCCLAVTETQQFFSFKYVLFSFFFTDLHTRLNTTEEDVGKLKQAGGETQR